MKQVQRNSRLSFAVIGQFCASAPFFNPSQRPPQCRGKKPNAQGFVAKQFYLLNSYVPGIFLPFEQ